MAKSSCCLNCCTVTSLLLLLIAIGLLCSFEAIYYAVINQTGFIKKTTTYYESWRYVPKSYDQYMNFYFFNVTNQDDIMNGAKPNVTQVGPVSYIEIQQKYDIEFLNDSHLVRYYENRTFIYSPETSDISEDEVLTLVNFPFWIVYQTGFATNPAFEFLLAIEFNEHTPQNNKLFQPIYQVAPKDIIWGYTDPLLVLMKSLVPSVVPLTEFGLFMGKNATHNGQFVVDTGIHNQNKRRGKISTWKHSDMLTIWANHESNMINGTDGETYRTKMEGVDQVYAFNTDVCRSFYLDIHDTEYKIDGIKTKKYSVPASGFASGKNSSYSKGFCTPNANFCQLDGVVNITNCEEIPYVALGGNFDMNIFMSLPNFLFADESYINGINGMNPVEEDHEIFAKIHQPTGLVVSGSQRAQINYLIQRNVKSMYPYYMSEFTKDAIMFPLFWIDEKADANHSLRTLIKGLVAFHEIGWIVLGALAILFLIIIIICISYIFCCHKKDPKDYYI